MRNLIDEFSKGQIDIKFYVVSPVTNEKTRSVFQIIGSILVLFFILYVLPKTFESFSVNGTILLCFAIFLSLFVFNKVTTKKLLETQRLGVVKFLENSFEIRTIGGMPIIEINYTELKEIKFTGGIPKEIILVSKYSHLNFKTFIVEFLKFNDTSVVVEVEDACFLTDKDRGKFRRIEPSIQTVLSNIRTKYGTNSAKIKTAPNTFFS